MRVLTPIKIKAGLDVKTGYAKYPDLNLVSKTIRGGLDWSQYVDMHGIGMHYDKTSGHRQESADSPFGQQWVCTCVPAAFAEEAAALFPDQVAIITPAEFETFYDTKAHAHEADAFVDTEALQAIKAKKDLGLAVPEEAAALNPNSPARGVRKNHRRYWKDFSSAEGVRI